LRAAAFCAVAAAVVAALVFERGRFDPCAANIPLNKTTAINILANTLVTLFLLCISYSFGRWRWAELIQTLAQGNRQSHANPSILARLKLPT
jgi:hypothetical protein